MGQDVKLRCQYCDYVTNRRYSLKLHEEKHRNGTLMRTSRKKSIFPVDENGVSLDPNVVIGGGVNKVEKKEPMFRKTDTTFQCKVIN